MDSTKLPRRKGRGAAYNPANRFEKHHVEEDPSAYEYEALPSRILTETFEDSTRQILAKNDSPDISFTYSLNPYRGCEHGCIYCYARPSHQYLGFSAGLDFETKIMVKQDAPALLEQVFRKKSWKPQVIGLSGNTDCYQPLERKFKLTRQVLEMTAKYQNPVGVITKNQLVTRDLDVLQELAKSQLVVVLMSVTSLKDDLINSMEPRTARPQARLKTIETLAKAGIPVGVMVAPIIPGLTHEEMPEIMKAAREHGAQVAGYNILHLTEVGKELFLHWLDEEQPMRAEKVRHRMVDMRGETMIDHRFGFRMRGDGIWAETIRNLFYATRQKLGFAANFPSLRTDLFRVPPQEGDQLRLF